MKYLLNWYEILTDSGLEFLQLAKAFQICAIDSSTNRTALMDLQAFAQQHPLQVTAKNDGGRAHIRVEGVLYGFQVNDFKYTVDSLIKQGIKDVRLYINTPGGSVFAANEIANEILRFEGTVSGFGGAIVASAGSYLATICNTFEMAENGQFMYHKPSAVVEGNENAIESRLKLLKSLTDQYRKHYAEKTGKTEEEIEALWSKGDVWLNAQEALDEGFVTSISKKTPVTKETAMLIAACGAPIKPEITKTETEMKNRDEIVAKLKLAKDATDAQIEAAIDQLAIQAQEAQTAEANLAARETAAVTALLDAAIVAKKITANQKPHFEALAKKDYDSTKALLDSMVPAMKASAHIDASGEGADPKAKWTLQDYLDNDPQALEVLMEKDPKKFEELQKGYF
ncbi:hypothetical protein EI546_06525 [Aequorivita sp. H23M31]|uniref:ATP-dependent Clp protease proteolytic subunit n=1 Tax=Aequorivita ciconiae TaxID=2494375 RepID=A0A410G296_9FLAO|nr:ATP-dependent Clp protease proteolytic subunit [Aequorivita sp. H23M31]QAA81404.1 hypothetical protein EI546_06525 [Aequorivita sp. H23M31]